jgi:hypothetical protein
MTRPLSLLALMVVASCVADRTPSHAGGPTADPATPVVVADVPADAEVAPNAPSDAGPTSFDASTPSDAGAVAKSDAAAVDARVEEPPKPLVVKGVRKCDEEETKNEVCFEKKKPGMCLDEYCVTDAVCPRYCAARGARDYAECNANVGDPKECMGIPECLKVMKEVRVTCANMGKNITNDCLRLTCPLVRSIPSAPP